jgi:hypothetical protein
VIRAVFPSTLKYSQSQKSYRHSLDLTKFKVRDFRLTQVLKSKKELKELLFLLVPNFALRKTKAQRDENIGRILLGDDTRRRGGHAAAHRLPM